MRLGAGRRPDPPRGERAREVLERSVHLAAELRPVGDVGGDRDRDHHARDGEARNGADTRAQAHSLVIYPSRSTYPTPRTLWITSGASRASSSSSSSGEGTAAKRGSWSASS